MTNSLVTAVQPIREKHLEAYTAWLNEMTSQHPDGVIEYAHPIRTDANAIGGFYRVDFAPSVGATPEFLEFRFEEMLGFKPWSGPIGAFELMLNPFRWDCAVFQINGGMWHDAPLAAWHDRWFGMAGGQPKASPADRPGGVIHSAVRDGLSLHVDFGSAHPQAFSDLVEIALQTGATRLSVHDAMLQARQQASPTIQ